MAINLLANFRKVNLVSIVAGVLALISMNLPWWGLEASILGSTYSNNWSLWNSPPSLSTTSFSDALDRVAVNIVLMSGFVWVLVFIAAGIALAGSFWVNRGYLLLGLGLSITGLVAYAVGLGYELEKMCQGTQSTSGCPSTIIGSRAQSGVVVSWGFQSGFYLFLISALVLIFAIILHHIFLRRTKNDVYTPAVVDSHPVTS